MDCLIQVLNLYSNDGQRLFEGATWAAHALGGPVMLIAGTAYAITLLGAWTLIGLAVLVLIVFLQVRTLKSEGKINSYRRPEVTHRRYGE